MGTHVFREYSKFQLTRVKSLLSASIDAWGSEVGLASIMEIEPLTVKSKRKNDLIVIGADREAVLEFEPKDFQLFCRHLMGVELPYPLSSEFKSVFARMQARLLAFLVVTGGNVGAEGNADNAGGVQYAPFSAAEERGAGWAVFGLNAERWKVNLYLSPQTIDNCLGIGKRKAAPQPPLKTSVRKALSDESVPVRCIIGSTAINLKDLAGLQVGDVLVLDQAVSSHVTLATAKGAFAKGFLCDQQGQVAVCLKQAVRMT